ncbi:MAG: hypothetical protein IPH08_00180, partial [Rhodocyclaceae bacterium]|nr:hypothetical protein [Rhodocyclaceae bacterium]
MPRPVAHFYRVLADQEVMLENSFFRQPVKPFEISPTHTGASFYLDGDVIANQK